MFYYFQFQLGFSLTEFRFFHPYSQVITYNALHTYSIHNSGPKIGKSCKKKLWTIKVIAQNQRFLKFFLHYHNQSLRAGGGRVIKWQNTTLILAFRPNRVTSQIALFLWILEQHLCTYIIDFSQHNSKIFPILNFPLFQKGSLATIP